MKENVIAQASSLGVNVVGVGWSLAVGLCDYVCSLEWLR